MRNAPVLLGNMGTPADADVLTREHVAWALERSEVVPDEPLFRVPTFVPQSAR